MLLKFEVDWKDIFGTECLRFVVDLGLVSVFGKDGSLFGNIVGGWGLEQKSSPIKYMFEHAVGVDMLMILMVMGTYLFLGLNIITEMPFPFLFNLKRK